MRSLRRKISTAVVCATAALTGTLSFALPAQAEDLSFYSTPSNLSGTHGKVVRSEAATFYIDPLKIVRSSASAQRIMYESSDRNGTPIAVTGTVLTPTRSWSGSGSRPIVAYAVGTQGLGDQCAPSRQLAAGSEYEGLFIEGLLIRGYGVVVTDYQGLGTAETHTYMSREVQGRAVLDSIRAAQQLPAANLPDAGPVAITGYSQGGGAAASAAELHPSYASELKLKGVVAGAVPADLSKVAKNLDGSLYFGFLGYAIAGLTATYDIDVSPYLNAKGQRVFADLEGQCTFESIAAYPFVKSSTLTADGKPVTDLLTREPFASVVKDQTIGNKKPTVPILMTHSLVDDVIPYSVGYDLAVRWCDRGANLRLSTNVAPGHVGGALASYPESFAFLEARFAGWPTLSSCWRL